MKKVNFITTLSPQKQYAIARWFWISCALCVCSVIGAAYFIMPAWLLHRELKHDVITLREKTKNYADAIKKRDALKSEHDLLRARSTKITNYSNHSKNPHSAMTVILQAAGTSIILEAIRFNKNECELTVLCPTPEHANVFIKRLSSSDTFAGAKLISLQNDTHAQQMRCVIKSKVVFV